MINISLNLELLLVLNSKKEWINKIPRHLPAKKTFNEQFLWVDSLGNQMTIGADFAAAETLNSYPVYIYRFITASAHLLSIKK